MSEEKELTPEEIVQAQASRLGGGWRMEKGIMPLVILTTVEAARVIDKLDHTHLVAIKFTDKNGKEHVLRPEDVTYIYLNVGDL